MKAPWLPLATIVAATSLLTGCDAPAQPPLTPPTSPASGGPAPSPPNDGPAPASSASPLPGASGSPAPTAPTGPSLPKPTAAEAAAVAKASNAFAFEMYRPIASKGGNLAFSPASISTAMAMTWGGAVGPTGDEMRKVMHFEGPVDQVLAASGKLVADLQQTRAPVLGIANRLFGEKTFKFQQPYLESTEKLFGAPLEPLDFVGEASASRKHINDWVAGRTRDRIKDLIPPPAIDKDTRLVLVNAVYFLGDWEEPFKKESTGDAPFFVDGKVETAVPTMRRAGGMPTAEVDGTQLVELPYVGGRFAMLVAVPAKKDGLAALEASLDAARFDRWVKALAPAKVLLALPRFEVDPPESIALKEVFLTLGMKIAFDRAKADFTKIADPPSPADRLFIGNVFHKAFVKVDEKGTEAAAATAVVMPRAGGAPEQPKQVTVDRPFLFFLRDRQSGLILFAGRVVDPQKKS